MKKLIFFLCLSPVALLGQSLSGVESVEYDASNNRYLASSDNTSIVSIAPDGSLSHFGSGLDASYGMEIMGNTLFCIEGSHILGYDLTSATEVMDLNIAGTGFLNGMGSDATTDRLWVSDFSNDRIYEIDASDLGNPSSNMVISNTLYQPNGVYHDAVNNRLLYVTWGTGRVVEVDLTDYSEALVVNVGVNSIDGIDSDSQGNYYLSHWSPAGITKYNNDFSASENVPVPGISSPADICYAQGPDSLAIPGNGQVLFVGFESTVGVLDRSTPDTELSIVPNPAGTSTVITYHLEKTEDVTLTIHDNLGRKIADLVSGEKSAGRHSIRLSGLNLSDGTYFCKMNKGGSSTTLTFTYTK